MRAAQIAIFIALALAGAPVATNAQPGPDAAPPPATAAETPTLAVDTFYTLGVGDVLEASVIGRSDYNARARVGPDGTIVLPLIGSLNATGLRPADLAVKISAALESGGFFSKPAVRVEVVTIASRFVIVLGQVGSPGLIPLDRNYRLSEMLAKVGAKISTPSDYVIITHADGGKAERFGMTDVATGISKDPILMAGDKIYVPISEPQVAYISGSVASPGAFPVTPGMTVRTAIARSGGVTENGNEKKVEIYRKGVKLPKPTPDTVVEPGDILKLGAKMF